MEPITIGIMLVAVGVKVSLYLYSSTLAGISGTAEALAEDHRNDIMTNSFSVISSTFAHYYPKAWFVDPIGAILISGLIFYNWLHVGMDHASKIVGLSAPPETLESITELAGKHHAQLELDIIRAYHFGPNFLVELEVVLPSEMSVKEAHDIALGLQQKVEQQSFVERCFVHVDYQTRGYNEHKI
jgi:divalent metal cation (Fe/Co/Zn/Cd) transporter